MFILKSKHRKLLEKALDDQAAFHASRMRSLGKSYDQSIDEVVSRLESDKQALRERAQMAESALRVANEMIGILSKKLQVRDPATGRFKKKDTVQ